MKLDFYSKNNENHKRGLNETGPQFLKNLGNYGAGFLLNKIQKILQKHSIFLGN